MPIFALGLNHHTAPVSVRERVAFQPDTVAEALDELTRKALVQEVAIVSTCNRTELVCAAESTEQAAAWLAAHHGLPLPEIAPYLYTLPDAEAVRHVFRVASGLDSMVLGEAQILGQLKEAARIAEDAGTLGATLHKLFQASFAVAKDVRSTTAIGANVVSMAAAAVRLAERIFERMSDTRVLFVGAGEMIELCANHFASASPRAVTVANRTAARGEMLAARLQGDYLPLTGLADALANYDVVVSCTASPLPVIGRGMVERALKARRYRPIVMVDLAVPRDIEPEVAELSDVFLYTVDDLSEIVSAGMEARQAAVVEAEAIIEQRVASFLDWMARRDAVPTIRALRAQGDALGQIELARARRLLARGEDPQRVIEQLAQGLTNKLLHAPTQYLGQVGEAELNRALDTVRRLYNLDVLDADLPRSDGDDFSDTP